ncbi:hypothetical protein CVT24_010667 [Panaeolus cyanescens]|uniref:CSC1/OSCA1-like 7TM region domain-containing protein n=1 Tax=Panaeolus cyanescens TaxID=181874 RepID=A0A409YNC9_9AGAR|nr:hypothetical protein CVT24_010667 [Panaeolus cyanescens]
MNVLSGLINQSVIAIGITVLCVSGHELMKRRRRGKALHNPPQGLGSKESWEFGYLYQGRSWARFPSPPTPAGWPLSWVKEAVNFPEDKINELRGLDAALYIRFLRGCFWFSLLHLLTTFPILFPIHVRFSDASVSRKSMTRASISSLVGTSTGKSLLWIHICLLFWITLTWIINLFWICNGAFRLRAATLRAHAKRSQEIQDGTYQEETTYYKHPHPQYAFRDSSSKATDNPTRGLRLRTIMVTNIPSSLRSEKDLQEYFQYYMSRKVEKPSMGLTSSTQPGFLNKSFAFLFNRAKRIPAHLPTPLIGRDKDNEADEAGKDTKRKSRASLEVPRIERVVIVRKMTELASLLERREDILAQLEAAHVKLANKALLAVKAAMEKKEANKSIAQCTSKALEVARNKRRSLAVDPERGEPQEEGTLNEEERMEELIEVLGPFVEEFGTQRSLTTRSKKAVSRTSRQAFKKLRNHPSEDSGSEQSDNPAAYPPSPTTKRMFQSSKDWTIWDALLSLPRDSLDAYQPLVNLSHLFRGRIVPSIDYYTAKLNLLTSLVTENRAKAATDYDAVSTAFVTFVDPADARRACKYLAVHPNNPLACLVTMAPMYSDIDWTRMMKSTFKGEFVKDWVVSLGVWGFTLFWLFPVSLLVGLVSIQNISLFWPSLKAYLDRHEWQSEVLQSFIPTLLVALLALLIPLILLLIAKKAHTITTLSALHDLIMTRYYKFLIVNVLVFFCVGTAAMQSFLLSFRSTERPNVIQVVAASFPTAGPFYVGWLIFTTAMHGGFELALCESVLWVYDHERSISIVSARQSSFAVRVTDAAVDWLPNHTLVIHVLLLFSIFNPFVLPFGTLYFFIQSGVVKNQLIHVYAKNYEGDGRILMIRMVRYSLDGLVLSQAVFLAYMVVLKKTANVGLAAFLIVVTTITKLMFTRMVRAQYEADDIAEAEIMCNGRRNSPIPEPDSENEGLITSKDVESSRLIKHHKARTSVLTWKLPAWVNFSYSTMQRRGNKQRRAPNPFGPHVSKNDHDRPRKTQDTAGKSEELICPSPDTPTIRLVTRSQTWSPRSRRRPSVGIDITPAQQEPLPVVPHPPPVPWDDQANLDLPYDNPYYTRTIENVLWLPRNPTGVLDLDDTVDLKVSITVEVAAGQIGTWLGLPETASPDDMSVHSKPESLAPFASTSALSTTSPLFTPLSLPEVDGTEEIDLPETIAKRIHSKESDVDQVVRPRKSTAFSRKPSGTYDKANNALSTGTRRRPSMLEVMSHRSFSEGASQGRPRSASILSTLQVPITAGQPPPKSSSDQEFGTRPDAHAQAEFVVSNQSASHLSAGGQRRPRTPNVSAAQAIFHEVLEEERQALRDRLEEETAEERSQNTTSWLTSWMFKKTG